MLSKAPDLDEFTQQWISMLTTLLTVHRNHHEGVMDFKEIKLIDDKYVKKHKIPNYQKPKKIKKGESTVLYSSP
jgi:hypothetical protein